MSSLLYKLIRLVLGMVFLVSGVLKLVAPVSFATLINAYGIIPENVTLPFAILLAVFETLAGIGLLFEIKGSLASVLGLLILFMMVLNYGIRMGLEVDCGCFGSDDPELTAFHGLQAALYRDICFTAGVIYLYIYRFYHSVTPRSIVQLFQNIQKGDVKNAAA